MNRSTFTILLVLIAAAMMTVGCSTKDKDRIAYLESENASLLQARAELDGTRGKLAQAQERCDELGMVIQSKQTEIDGLSIRLANALAKPVVVAPPKTQVPPGWQETATGAKITLGSDILFSAGRATLTKKGLASLRSVASTLKGTYPGARVRVYGFTDSDPIVKTAKLWKDNLDLSANRAMAVARELRKRGVSAANIETIAMGKERAIAAETKNGDSGICRG